MSPARRARAKTVAILGLAGAVALGALLLTRAEPRARVAPPPTAPTAPSAAGVTVRALLQSSHVLRGTHETYLALTVSSDGEVSGQRPPLNVAVVIDRSGSMTGEKLVHAKQAAVQLLSELDDRDRFSIVSYGSDVALVYPSQRATPTARAAARIAIEGIRDDGGTNLSGGLVAGKQQLLANPVAGAVARVVLISDGMANEGVLGADDLAALAANTAERGVSITTVGVGLDFDERTMTRIAVAGRGNYYFVESSAVLAEMFDREMKRLGATTATDVELTVHPAAGVEVLEALGYPMYDSSAGLTIPVADLTAGDHRKIVLRLRVSANHTGAVDLLSYRATFRPVGSDQLATLEGAARAEVTGDHAVWRANLDPGAALHIERARAAAAINQATQLYEEGRAGEADKVLEGYRQAASQLATDVGDAEVTAELEEQVLSTARKAQKNLRSAPSPASSAGKRSQKSNRADAYDLFVK